MFIALLICFFKITLFLSSFLAFIAAHVFIHLEQGLVLFRRTLCSNDWLDALVIRIVLESRELMQEKNRILF